LSINVDLLTEQLYTLTIVYRTNYDNNGAIQPIDVSLNVMVDVKSPSYQGGIYGLTNTSYTYYQDESEQYSPMPMEILPKYYVDASDAGGTFSLTKMDSAYASGLKIDPTTGQLAFDNRSVLPLNNPIVYYVAYTNQGITSYECYCTLILKQGSARTPGGVSEISYDIADVPSYETNVNN
jgi:hypothetical protein